MNDENPQLEFFTVLASCVHDMKNSLGMVLNSVDDLVEEYTDTDSPAKLQKVTQLRYEAKRLNNNLIQLLTIYNLNKERYTLNLQEYSLWEFLEELQLEYQQMLQNRKIELEVDCDDELYGFFDRELLSGVLNNVFNNTIRYAKGKVRLSAVEKEGGVLLRVEDDGAGYPASMLDKDPNDLTGANVSLSSTGLGLYFSAIVASKHVNQGRSGRIDIANDSALGGGTFSLWVP